MKMLLDENLAPRLARSLADISTHDLEQLLRKYSAVVHTFYNDPTETILVLA